MKNIFVAKYKDSQGFERSLAFDKRYFDESKATQYLEKQGIKNFFFFFEPNKPVSFGENGIMFSGDIGFDITVNTLMPYLEADNEIILDSFGGDLFEGYKIHDAIKKLNKNPKITIMGIAASSATLPLIATENSHITENSRILIHNPWQWIVEGDDSDFRKAAKELEKEKIKLSKLYSVKTSIPENEILALMTEERWMSAEEAFQKGFVNNFKTENKMTEKQFDEKANSFFERIANFFKPKTKNLILQSADGLEINIPDIDSEDQIEVGITGVTAGGSTANGEYVMPDGRTLVIEAGTIMEIKESEETSESESETTETIEDLKAEIERLKQAQQNALNAFQSFKNLVKSEVKFEAEEKPEKEPVENKIRKPFKNK